MKVNRVEQHQIKSTHKLFKTIDDLCFKSKNLYNYANYIIRQEFINNKKWIRANDLDKMIQSSEPYKELGSQASQKLLQLLDNNWNSFFVAIKDWSSNKDKYLGKPNLPNYKNKDGRCVLILKNIQCRVENNYLYFSWKPLKNFNNLIKTNIKGRLIQVRFIPKGITYLLEIVYEIEIKDAKVNSKNICSIDLGINNFVTIVNNIGLKPIIINGKGIKSINQFYNKKKSKIQSNIKLRNNISWSNKLRKLSLKRTNRLKNLVHNTSRYIIEYCLTHDIDTLVLGYNINWKQDCSMGNKNNQNFECVPYDMLFKQLLYKCQNNNILFIHTDESYTSGTSFLDNEEPIKDNYNKTRRIQRGLFKSNNGVLINSDVNGAFQIMKKVFPNAFADGIKGCLTPTIINVVKFAT